MLLISLGVEGRRIILTKGKCCPIWTVLTVILILAAIAVTVYVILQKLHLLGYHYQPMDEGYWPDEKEADNDVPRATDHDFV